MGYIGNGLEFLETSAGDLKLKIIIKNKFEKINLKK